MRKEIEAILLKLQRADVTLARVERELGLLEGDLSRALRSTEPSFHLVALLACVAENPKAVLSTIRSVRTGAV